jgi:hypothetical protein
VTPHVTSVPNGAALERPREGDIDPSEDGAFRYLWDRGRLKAGPERFDKIILATDDDHIVRAAPADRRDGQAEPRRDPVDGCAGRQSCPRADGTIPATANTARGSALPGRLPIEARLVPFLCR